MVRVLQSNSADFSVSLKQLLSDKSETNESVNSIVSSIIDAVKQQGDKALVEYTAKLDKKVVDNASQLKVSKQEIAEAFNQVPIEVTKALEFAAERITRYHKEQLPKDHYYTDEEGVTLGNTFRLNAARCKMPAGDFRILSRNTHMAKASQIIVFSQVNWLCY